MEAVKMVDVKLPDTKQQSDKAFTTSYILTKALEGKRVEITLINNQKPILGKLLRTAIYEIEVIESMQGSHLIIFKNAIASIKVVE